MTEALQPTVPGPKLSVVVADATTGTRSLAGDPLQAIGLLSNQLSSVVGIVEAVNPMMGMSSFRMVPVLVAVVIVAPPEALASVSVKVSSGSKTVSAATLTV